MSFELFKKIFDEVRPLSITFSGLGEPLLNPEALRIFAYAFAHGTRADLFTNGTLILPDTALELVGMWKGTITVSVDAANFETYRKVRRGDFEKVLAGIKNLVDAQSEVKNPSLVLRLAFVIQRENEDELSEFLRFVSEQGVRHCIFVMPFEFSVQSRTPSLDTLDQKVRHAKEVALELGIKTNLDWILWEIGMRKSGRWKSLPCAMPWISVFFTASGHARICCYHKTYKVSFDGKFNWNHKLWRRTRRDFARGIKNFPECSYCMPRDIPYILSLLANSEFRRFV